MNELNNLIDIEVDEIATAHPNYFPGQYLLAEDFNLEHKYLNDRLRYTNKSLHVSGIIEGLTVEKEGTNSVKITPGAAIDNQGNMIVLTEDKTFAEFNTSKQGELYVKYIKQKDIQQQKNVIDSYTRWQEIPQLGFADTTPETGVKLAQITLEEGAITKVVTDVREYSGLSLPTSDGTELTLRYGGKRQSTNEAVLTGSLHIDQDLTVDGQLGIGTNTPEAKLHIHGELKLQEGVKVNKISNDVELQENSNNIIPTQKAIKTYADTKALLAGNAAQDFNAKDLTVEGWLEIKGNLSVQDNISATGLIQPSAGGENTKGIKFPLNQGGGQLDSAWIRYYVREDEKTTLEIGTGNDNEDHIALMPEKGNVGIGTNNPDAKLHIHGELKLQEGVMVNNFSNDIKLQEDSDQIIPTQNAIKRYIDQKLLEARAQILYKGMIMLWPVVKNEGMWPLPYGWKECDGLDGRPDVNRRLVCGIGSESLDSFKGRFTEDSDDNSEGAGGNAWSFVDSREVDSENSYLYSDVGYQSMRRWETNGWPNYRITRPMLPDHGHLSAFTSFDDSAHSHTYKTRETDDINAGASGFEYSFTAYYRSTNDTIVRTPSGEGAHQHKVEMVVNTRGDGFTFDSKEVQTLPRPPLIVLRYIIYWPD